MDAMNGQAALAMVAAHAACVILEVVGILLVWHFAEQLERQAEAELAARTRADRDAERLRAEAARGETERERRQSDLAAARARRLADDVTTVRDGATGAISAVASVADQLGALSAAVEDIAKRSHQAALTAQTGQQSANEAATEIEKLQTAMSEIAQVNEVIAQLASQTNLLALNATIEAARAGELGKGFAVVATEVKALANQTAASAARVSDAIETVVMETDTVTRRFATTSGQVAEIHALQADIAASVEEQAAVLAQVDHELSTAAAAAHGVLENLDALTRDRVG